MTAAILSTKNTVTLQNTIYIYSHFIVIKSFSTYSVKLLRPLYLSIFIDKNFFSSLH